VSRKFIVLKLGTGVLSAGEGNIHHTRLVSLSKAIKDLYDRKQIQTIVVSSGAVGLGMGTLGIPTRPDNLSELRACAAIGQCSLMKAWSDALAKAKLIPGQVLLTREDFSDIKRSKKVKETLECLTSKNVVPIVNENDSVSDEEIKFGDNDVLSALLASLVEAEVLIILSTAKGLMTHPSVGELIPFVAEISPAIEQLAMGTESATAVGGMITKIEAAKVATKSGCAVFIGSGETETNLNRILDNQSEGTFFAPAGLPIKQRKRWLAFFPQPKGIVHIDDGACDAILQNGSSLLASGIVRTEGDFAKAEIISIVNPQGNVIAKGVTRFKASDLEKVLGYSSDDVLKAFPGKIKAEVIHRDHLATCI